MVKQQYNGNTWVRKYNYIVSGGANDHGGVLLAILALLLHVPDEPPHWTNS